MIACYFGRKGSGKTTSMQRDARTATRMLVHDPVFQWGSHATQVSDPAALLAIVAKPEWRVALTDPAVENGAWLAQVAVACGPCLLVYDECDWSFSAAKVPKELRDAISYSRHYRIDIFGGARRPSDVPRLLTANADRITCHRVVEPRDLDYLTGYAGTAFAGKVARLRSHESATWSADDDDGPMDGQADLPLDR